MSTSTTFANVNSIAIGGFDGMHLAHQQLFSLLDEKYGAVLVVETGHANMTKGMKRQEHSPHPLKIYQLSEIKHLDAKNFVLKLLKDFPSLSHIVVGYDFHFGKNRAFDSQDLKKYFDGKVSVVDEVRRDGIAIHSHVIRKLLTDGNIKQANHFLGYDYTLSGEVITGQGLGSKSLVPTINVISDQLLPKAGVYASLTRVNGEVAFHPSVTFLGHRVSTDGKEALETHILDTEIDDVLSVEIALVDYLRENKKFEDLAMLKKAINLDMNQAKKILKGLSL